MPDRWTDSWKYNLTCSSGYPPSTWLSQPTRPHRKNDYVEADGCQEAHKHSPHRISCHGPSSFCVWPLLCPPFLLIFCSRKNLQGSSEYWLCVSRPHLIITVPNSKMMAHYDTALSRVGLETFCTTNSSKENHCLEISPYRLVSRTASNWWMCLVLALGI